jgi:hypothetical protein
VYSGTHVLCFGAIFCPSPQGRTSSFFSEEGDRVNVIKAGHIYQTTKCKQSKTKLFTMKKETLELFETLLAIAKHTVSLIRIPHYPKTSVPDSGVPQYHNLLFTSGGPIEI